jgi:Ca2+-binding RTX toxin-like protein
VVTWESYDDDDGSSTCARARLFTPDGRAIGADFVVASTTADAQLLPAVAALSDGRFVVTWYSYDTGDGSGYCIRAQIFDPTTFAGTVADENWTGGNFVDRLYGGSGNDTLSGVAGDDAVSGDGGNDTLDGGAGKDRLSGLIGADALSGGLDDDRLDGGAGADRMSGGAGNDLFHVDDAGDVVSESGGSGMDQVLSAIGYSLAAAAGAVENLTLAGRAPISGRGNALANAIIGNTAANVLEGLAGNDMLNGAAGADSMLGGAGNDLYAIDNANDVISESGGSGVDRVLSSITFSLGDAARVTGAVEHLTLTGPAAFNGTGNALANAITGNAAANTLDGLAGNDMLNGAAGADTMLGRAGNDRYVVDNARDVVSENGGSGIDTVLSSIGFSLANAARIAGAVERLTLTGVAAVNGTGNSLANLIVGNAGANVLDGGLGNDALTAGAGSDTLKGKLGNDVLTGAAGNNDFVFDTRPNATTNRDVVTDFTNAAGNNDRFHLDNAVFAKLGAPGSMNPAFFRAGSAALDANDYVVYNKATGVLTYDVNGNAAGGTQQVAVLIGRPALTAADFLVI